MFVVVSELLVVVGAGWWLWAVFGLCMVCGCHLCFLVVSCGGYCGYMMVAIICYRSVAVIGGPPAEPGVVPRPPLD